MSDCLITNGEGYYQVGSSIFYSKTKALIEATRTGIHPHWHFADSIFTKLPWQSQTTWDLREIYKNRAKYLREKYDYLVLSYSGGSDSYTALNSFLSNGMKVDEILVRWPISATENKYKVSYDTRAYNMLSEWDLVLKPDIEYLTKNYPDIKITVYDWSSDINAEMTEEDWYGVNDFLNPGVFKKFRVISESEQRMIDAGKKTAVIFGVDKPQIAYKDGALHFYFLDKLSNCTFVPGDKNRTPERFFWSPECPEIVLAQTQIIYNYFLQHTELLDLVDWNKRTTIDKTPYDKIIRSIIYPDWNLNKFQTVKPYNMVRCSNDAWMFQYLQDNQYFQSWESGVDSFKNVIDTKYYHYSPDGQFNGWVGFISPFYNLGPISRNI